MRGANLEPFIQGRLDGLCGVYSIVNATRFALQDASLPRLPRVRRRGQLDQDAAQELFLALLKALLPLQGHASRLVNGISEDQLPSLIAIAAEWVYRRYRLRLTVCGPSRGVPRIPTAVLVKRIDRHLARPGTAAIVGAHPPWDHWTVATGVRGHRLRLLDSNGDASVALRPGRRKLRYHAGLLDSRALFLITLSAPEAPELRRAARTKAVPVKPRTGHIGRRGTQP